MFSGPFLGVHNAKTHRLARILFDTRQYHTERLQKLALPTQRSFEIPLPHGTRAQVQLLLPPSWREELRDAAFPVLVEVLVHFYIYKKPTINSVQ